MVNLPDQSEQQAETVAVPSTTLRPRSQYSWRYGRYKAAPRPNPKGLIELDKLAKQMVRLMEKHGPKSDSNYHKAMDLLRQQYNLHFIILCEECNGPHAVDELLAPER